MKNQHSIKAGDKFGRLTAVKIANKSGHSYKWLFECECGNKKEIDIYSVLNNKTKSCGCLQVERARIRNSTHGACRNGKSSRLYGIWQQMRNRCFSPKTKSYKNYGARGIKVCDEWLKFENFQEWAINNGYADDLSIDRIDNDGNYEPSNCRWADIYTQANNKRRNVYYEAFGEKHTLTEFSRIYGINWATLYRRVVTNGWDVETALTKPLMREYYGKRKCTN